MKHCEEYQPTLEFMRDIVKLADRCNDLGADKVNFELGPVDGMVMDVTIEFNFREVEEHGGNI